MLLRPRRGALWSVALALGVCFTLPGCGGGPTKVRGKVTAKGKTVVWGSVTLVDSTGVHLQGDIDLNGNYEIDGVRVGSVKIGVVSRQPDLARGGAGGADPKGKAGPVGAGGRTGGIEDPREKFMAEKGMGKSEDTRPRPPAGAWFALDPKYADPETSGLTGEVKRDAELNIDLK